MIAAVPVSLIVPDVDNAPASINPTAGGRFSFTAAPL
jgi:hypothetical protein